MGAYINPVMETKEEFLAREGVEIDRQRAVAHQDFTDKLVVAQLDNGIFSAAAIAFSEEELRVFTDPNDRRHITYFIVPREKLLPVSNLASYLSGGNQ